VKHTILTILATGNIVRNRDVTAFDQILIFPILIRGFTVMVELKLLDITHTGF